MRILLILLALVAVSTGAVFEPDIQPDINSTTEFSGTFFDADFYTNADANSSLKRDLVKIWHLEQINVQLEEQRNLQASVLIWLQLTAGYLASIPCILVFHKGLR